VIFIAVALLLTFSRQSWVGAILGVIALGVRRRPGMMVGVVLATVVALVFVSVPNSHQSFGSYLVSAGDTNTASSGTRLSLYQQALQLIPQTPLQGVGPGLYSTLSPNANVTVYYAHNFVLDSIIEIGFAGCVAMLTVFALSLREGILRAGRLGFGMLAAFLVANMFDDVVYFPRNGFLLAAAFALAAGSALTSERLAVRRGTAGAAPPPATSGVPGRRPVTVGEPL